jgi:hypothetical protein
VTDKAAYRLELAEYDLETVRAPDTGRYLLIRVQPCRVEPILLEERRERSGFIEEVLRAVEVICSRGA